MLGPLFELVCLACQSLAGVGTPSLSYAQLVLPPVLLEQLEQPAQVASLQPASEPWRARVVPANVGEDWSLPRGRSLSVYLTPSPERCAPLVEMKF
jgi:hypothetical protein